MSFQRSAARHPCPCCGRTKTSHCAWSLQGNDDDAILCHDGERFGPPPGLAIGDVIAIEGRPFALTATGKGFAGRSHVFRPHRPREDKGLLLPARLRSATAQLLASGPDLEQRVEALQANAAGAFGPQQQPNPGRLERIDALHERCRYLLPQLGRAIRSDPTLTPLAEKLLLLLRDLRFERDHLRRCATDPDYGQASVALAPTELSQEPSDWAFWQQQKAIPTHPWVLEQRTAGEAFWSPVAEG